MKTKSRKNKDLVKNGLFVIAVFLGTLMITLTSSENQKITRNNKSDVIVKSNVIESKNSSATNDFYSYENFEKYLVEEEEPALTLDGISDFTFSFPEKVKKEKHFEENEYLKNELAQKMESINEMLALVEKTKNLLAVETEEPLCLEDWMTDDACWCAETAPVLMAKK